MAGGGGSMGYADTPCFLQRAAVFFDIFGLTAPLFLLVLLGYAIVHWGRWPDAATDALTRFVFSVALPMLLFKLMAGFRALPTADTRLLGAFFGACLVVFLIGRGVGAWMFRQDGVSQSVFALGGVFSNNVLLGIPLAHIALGEGAIASVSLVLVFNALILWTLVTISVEWAKRRSLSMGGLAAMAKGVITNPIVASIVGGTLFGYTGVPMPGVVDQVLGMVGQAAAPLSLIVLGMGLSQFGIRDGWRESVAICALKLVAQPLVVWLFCRWLALPSLETQVVVMLGSLPVGANVYLMSRQFQTLGSAVASSLVMSTALAAVTTPLAITLTKAFA